MLANGKLVPQIKNFLCFSLVPILRPVALQAKMKSVAAVAAVLIAVISILLVAGLPFPGK